MAEIGRAQIVAFYLFDVAETADLSRVPALVGGPAVPARLAPKPATPAYVQYEKPPLSFDGEAVSCAAIDEFRVRIRVFDYGVLSVGLTRSFEGAWNVLLALSQTLLENPELESRAEQLCRTVLRRLQPGLTGARETFLSEDYVVFSVMELDRQIRADQLLTERGRDIATLLRGERQQLSDEEIGKVLERRISYLADDLVVAAGHAAVVDDAPTGAQAALEIAEFANSQLLEFRHYDAQLDDELTAIYARLQRPRWYDQWIGSRY